ncbi:hypothetical protein Q2T40_18845 [Winogradskyella maritima]|uniref:Capsular polysaccharide export protein n=1 Tax=Winogradskyella maritima TaxID=1517766 RepID=A0ABV8ADM1_9FLAO|nr:hypothetical protein [Winogradskyella maritima]
MSNICFIANYYKTDVFLEVSKILEKKNHTVFWIVSSKKQYDWLLSKFPSDRLLYIGKKEVLASKTKQIDVDLKLNELIYNDRVLKHESRNWSYNYLKNLTSLYYNFFKTNKISYIFGEITWAHEILAYRLSTFHTELETQFLNPHTIRVPNGRFAFFTDEFQSCIKEVKRVDNEVFSTITAEKPEYLKLNDKWIDKKKSISHNIGLLKNFIFRTNQDANDVTLYSSPYNQFKIRTTEIINRFIFNKFVSETTIEKLPENGKFVLFTLHKQPEASIDVIGRYYENQLSLIENIWRFLPENYYLLVKEHSNAIGDRSYSFYSKVKSLRNVFLIDNRINSYDLIEISSAIFTVSGTVAYEAALMSTMSFTFAPAFFNKLKCCREISLDEFKHNTFIELMSKNNTGLSNEGFSNWLMSNSFKGVMSDAFGNPRSIEPENINLIANAIEKIVC